MNSQQVGFAYGLIAYAMWGSFPLYFHLLADLPAIQVIAQRVFWSAVFCALLLTVLGRWPRAVTALRDKRLMVMLFCSALLVGFNWWVFVFAVGRGEVLASSLGYFMTPLCSVLLARVFLNERMNNYQWFAVALAVVAVVYLLYRIGSLPLVSLALAVSFAFYGLIRKQAKVGPLSGLFVEAMLLTPMALIYLGWLSHNSQNMFFSGEWSVSLLLIFSGVVTALPLLAFAAAAERLSLTIVGFMMYINPSLQFIIAITLLGESVSRDQLVSFALIWLALIVFSVGSVPKRGADKKISKEVLRV